ncbi:branched-chain amino acid aminotransferase [Luteimonas sp. 3794]|uniref:branched-chain amino acid aminotransferase n=1 Tax=Luteimonas sp. 3794 TaxID=2817730 RepID=UPI00286752A7|nr:branched-chain amino acid aminotransferase [Luteimonas sp. 3794]MDR6990934.1 branched-chain amino acid aminotransferase [Luteimonas sp. 3794]
MTDATFPTFRHVPSQQARAQADREKILADPGFGVHFTDHMVAIDWTVEDGWHDAHVRPYGPLTFSPAAAVLHYGQEIFEGMKAFRHADGSVWTFRPESNGRRLQHSARRMALPELPVDLFVESIKQLVQADEAWVPAGGESSLYIRPFMIANEDFLGVRPARRVAYYVIASPAGAYFKGGVKPVSIWLSRDYARAGRGGTGSAKCGGNYASSLLPQREAVENGCAQVLFLDAETNKYVEELGGMNVFLVLKDGSVVTPSLTGSILEGITRDSVIQLLRDRGHTVTERRVEITEWIEGVRSGEIAEVFACGTAASISPIGVLKGHDFSVGDADAQPGEITMAIRKDLLDIQYGRAPDRHGWLTRLV